jgi:hypothetical protein
MMTALVKWATYNVGGTSLGNSIPNFSVVTDVSAAANLAPQDWQILSVYVDNEGVNFPVYIRFPDSNYTISCPPNSSGWFPAYTGARSCTITGIGITNQDIANLAQTSVYFTDDYKVPYLDPEQATAVDFGLASQTIQFGSGGSSISSIAIINGGSGYSSNTITVSGAGGTGATVSAARDLYTGGFSSLTLTNAGAGYQGAPSLILPSQVAPSNFVLGAFYDPTTTTYPNRSVVFGGTIWGMFPTGAIFQALSFPNVDTTHWFNTGIAANVAAQFSIAMTPASGGNSISQQSNYAPFALGDQIKNYIDDITATGVFRQNLFGSPYNSGSIILTGIHVQQLTTGPAGGNNIWQVEDTAGNQVFAVRNSNFGTLFSMQNANIRLPATSSWQLRCTAFSPGSFTVAHGFSYTVNPNL